MSMPTTQEESASLVLVQLEHEVRAVAVQDRLAALEQRDLEIEVVQDLDERALQARYLEPVLDAADEPDGVNLRADVLQQAPDECYDPRSTLCRTEGAS